jgi:isopenicillin-N epimerase
LRRQLQTEPVDFLWRRAPELLRQARERLADFLHTEPRQLIFTVNVTAAINIVAAALRLVAPGEILVTDHEYGSMRYAWERAAQRQGLILRLVPIPTLPTEPHEIVDVISAALRPETRLLMVSHVLYTTGMVMPVREICAAARRQGVLTLVDGAHAPGMIPVDLHAIGCDFYGANCHKWLLAPIGAGFLYMAPGNEDRLQPLAVSWGWHYDRSRADLPDELGSTPRIRSFEFEGTRDPSAWLAVPTAITFHESLGPRRIRQRHRELTDHVRSRLASQAALQLVTPAHGELRGALTAFRLPPCDLAALRKELWETYRLEVPIIEHADGNFLRISTHFYNTEEEIERLATALSQLLPRR